MPGGLGWPFLPTMAIPGSSLIICCKTRRGESRGTHSCVLPDQRAAQPAKPAWDQEANRTGPAIGQEHVERGGHELRRNLALSPPAGDYAPGIVLEEHSTHATNQSD